MPRTGKSRRNVYSQLSDTQTTPSPSMILLELKSLCIDGPGPMSDIVTELQKVIPGKSKLQRTQLMERVFHFFLNHPVKITCVCSLPSVHQEPDHFFPLYIKIIYENQIFFFYQKLFTPIQYTLFPLSCYGTTFETIQSTSCRHNS